MNVHVGMCLFPTWKCVLISCQTSMSAREVKVGWLLCMHEVITAVKAASHSVDCPTSLHTSEYIAYSID